MNWWCAISWRQFAVQPSHVGGQRQQLQQSHQSTDKHHRSHLRRWQEEETKKLGTIIQFSCMQWRIQKFWKEGIYEGWEGEGRKSLYQPKCDLSKMRALCGEKVTTENENNSEADRGRHPHRSPVRHWLRDPAVESERFRPDLKTHLFAGHQRHERIRGVTVSRNGAIQINIYLLTCLCIFLRWRFFQSCSIVFVFVLASVNKTRLILVLVSPFGSLTILVQCSTNIVNDWTGILKNKTKRTHKIRYELSATNWNMKRPYNTKCTTQTKIYMLKCQLKSYFLRL